MKRLLTAIAWMLGMMTAQAQTYQVPVSEQHEKMQTGKYEPTWQSLETHQTPEWFRDAKFGIWAHWGPQCVEGSGDWMARSMYMEGSREYKWHVAHYGHPSEFGFKDILPLFKAEKWDPEALVEKYKRCGAQYFFVLGNHHDNYDLWDSKYQPWNSKNIGPEKDILDGWAKAAKKAGLPLGISFHADHAWTWYEPSQRYDMNGRKAGVYYDGKMTKEDGTELSAYIVSGYNPETHAIVLTRATDIPANTGLLLRGTADAIVNVPVKKTYMVYANLLVAVTSAETIVPQTEGDYTNYILADGSYGVDWYTLSQAGSIGANKAYLQLPTNAGSGSNATRQLTWIFEDATGIRTVEESGHTTSDWYTLDGKKLSSKPTAKGIYIYNGKKTVIR